MFYNAINISSSGTCSSNGLGILTSGTSTLTINGNSQFQYHNVTKTKLYNILDEYIESSSYNEFHLDIIITTINTIGIKWYSSMKKNPNSCLMDYVPQDIQEFLDKKEIQFSRNEKISNITDEL